MARKDRYVLYCRNQLNDKRDIMSQNGIVGVFSLRTNLRGDKRVLKFKLKFLNLLELCSSSDDIEILTDKSFEEDIRGEIDFYIVKVSIDSIEEVYQVQKLFNS